MFDPSHVLQMLDQIREQIDAIQAELLHGQPSPGAPVAEYDLETGLPIKQVETAYIPPLVEGEEIIGGVETDDFPDCCAVGDGQGYYCSGTLIAPNLVVTADHCVGATRVFLKGRSIFQPQDGETLRVTQRISHPEVDLQVLILERDAQVPPRHVAQAPEVYAAHSAIVAGFGTIDPDGTLGYGLKRSVEVPIMSLACSASGDPKRYGCQSGREMVAGHRGLRRDTCRGDSGGPLYVQASNGEYYLLGATSRGARGGLAVCGDGGVYVRVDLCLDWIRQVTGIDVAGPRI